MTSFSIQSFGCRVNQAEAFLWTDKLQRHGLKYKKDFHDSDLVLINSCTLTRRADRDVRKFIRNVSRLNPRTRLIVTGCYAERAPQEFKDMPQIWRMYSNKEKRNIIQDIISIIDSKEPKSNLSFRSRALVKIQDGCDFHCTFCIVPKVRGGSISIDQEIIFSQVKRFIDQGFREIVLTGIHLCSYGLDLYPQTSLLDLIKEIEDLEGLGRVRLSSLDPRFLTFPFLKYITKSRKVCPHFHLSLQNGSNDVLRQMGRKIKVKDYKEILSYLRQNSPQASLGTDIIVGFPGESEEDFEKTYQFLESSPLTYFHVFSYSPRPWTTAAGWPQINERVKKERAASLRKLAQKKNLKFRQLFLGKEFKAIVIKKGKVFTQLLTPNYLKVSVADCPWQEREEIRVRVTEVNSEETKGVVIPLSI